MAPSRGDSTPAPGTNAITTTELSWRAAAASNILQAQKKNGRLGGRKSRRGCLTCKHRRIKCDETQPGCRNCTDSNRQCSGYAAGEVQKAAKTSNTLIGVQLSQSLGLQESDRRTFDYFLSWTAPRLAGVFDKDFWCGQVLQVAQVEPGILDALLAISQLYEHPQCLQNFRADASQGEMNLPEESVGTSALGTGRPEAYTKSLVEGQTAAMFDQQHHLAVKHYNRAIGHLMDRLASGRATLLVALLSCVLFMCVEVLRDNVFAALNLFTKGYQILSQIDPSDSRVDNDLFVTLKLTMTRFGILAAMYGHPDLLDGRSMYGEIDEKSELRTMLDARTALYVVMADNLAFHRAAIPWRRLLIRQSTTCSYTPAGAQSLSGFEGDSISQGTGTRPSSSAKTGTLTLETGLSPLSSGLASTFESDIPDEPTDTVGLPAENVIPEVLQQQRAHFEFRLLQWYTAMQSIQNKDEEAVANLMMYYHASFPLMASRLSPYESIHDDYTHHYEEMVRFAEIYYRSKATQPSFTIEPGAVPILWMVATKCRVPSLRRRALNLIKKAPNKECMWARDSVAEFAARVIAIEEEDLSPLIDFPGPRGTGSPSAYEVSPPESSRIHDLEILRDMSTGKSALRVTRYLHGPGGVRIEHVRDYPV